MKANIMKHDSQYINLRTGGMLASRRDCVKGLVGLAGILATGQAPAAFVRSMLGARGMAFGGGKKLPSAKDYVQQDLLVHFNAKENAGYGAYNPSATTWIDLSGNGRSATLTGATEWNDEFGLVIKAFNQNGLATFNGIHNAIHTIEIVYRCFAASGQYCRVLAENQWLCCGGMRYLSPYYVYGWGIDKNVLTDKTSNTAVAQTIAIRDDGTKHPELFNNGESEGVFEVNSNNLGNITSTLSNRVALGRGMDAAYMAVRIYNRCLTDYELDHNAKLDKQLFKTIDNGEPFELVDSRYITKLDESAFSLCKELKEHVSLEVCTYVGSSCFRQTNITSLRLPSLTQYTDNISSIGYTNLKLAYIELGNITYTSSETLIGPDVGKDAPADQKGIKLTVKVKNTMASLRALTYFPFDIPTWGKWLCSDGYIIYENGAWTDHANQ